MITYGAPSLLKRFGEWASNKLGIKERVRINERLRLKAVTASVLCTLVTLALHGGFYSVGLGLLISLP